MDSNITLLIFLGNVSSARALFLVMNILINGVRAKWGNLVTGISFPFYFDRYESYHGGSELITDEFERAGGE